MHRAVKTTDRHIVGRNLSPAFVSIILIIRMLPHILQGGHHLERGARRVRSLGGPIEHRAVFLVRIQVGPVFLNLVRIIGGLGKHHQDFPRRSFHHHHRPFVVPQRQICRLLKVRVQCGHHRITPMLLILKFVLDLFQEKRVGTQQGKIFYRFQAGLSKLPMVVSDHMGKYIPVGVSADLRAVLRHLCQRKRISLSVRKKQQHKKIGHSSEFFVLELLRIWIFLLSVFYFSILSAHL